MRLGKKVVYGVACGSGNVLYANANTYPDAYCSDGGYVGKEDGPSGPSPLLAEMNGFTLHVLQACSLYSGQDPVRYGIGDNQCYAYILMN